VAEELSANTMVYFVPLQSGKDGLGTLTPQGPMMLREAWALRTSHPRSMIALAEGDRRELADDEIQDALLNQNP
jgi:hypothetical protein